MREPFADVYNNNQPMPFENLTKVKGDWIRHIEQLWDEIKTLKAQIKKLEENQKHFT